MEFSRPLASRRRGGVLCAGRVLRAEDGIWEDGQPQYVTWRVRNAAELAGCEAVVEGFYDEHWVALAKEVHTLR